MLIVPFVAQIFLAVGLTGYWSLRNGQLAIEQLANQLQKEIGDRIHEHLDHHFDLPHQVNQVNAQSIRRGILKHNDSLTLGQYFLEQMKAYPDFAYINFGDPQGNFVAINRASADDLQLDLTRPSHLGTFHSYHLDEQGNPTKLVRKVPYNHRTDAWYTDTIAAKKPVWSSVYFWEDEQILAISASHPVYNDQQELLGAVGIDFLLDRINQFLQRLKPTAFAQIFIVERNGLLVASSTNEPSYTVKNGEPNRIAATDSSNIRIRTIARSLNLNQAKNSSKVTIENQPHYVQVMPWKDQYGLDWVVVLAIPESDFTGQINQNTRTTLLLCSIVFIVTTLIGIFTARWISRNIDRLKEATAAIASGNLNQTVKGSKIEELDTLSRSFNAMAQQMQETVTALEENNSELERRVAEQTEKLSQALYSLQMEQARIIQTEKMSSLGRMIAGIAHEINNPVSFIHGNLVHAEQYMRELLDLIQLYEKYQNTPNSEIKNYLLDHDVDYVSADLPKIFRSMQEGTERIQSIILNLRNFSRLDEAQLKQVDLHEGIDNTLLLLQYRLKPTAKRCNIQIIKQYNNLPKVECYAGQLNQVFLNLLSNAIDALDEAYDQRHPEISITTEVINSNWIVIRIRDNANGIPEEVRSKIFDPFFTTKPIGSGTGLGLSISYQIIVSQHNGSLTYRSTLGEGTEFTIEIPTSQFQS